jgi:hypothetical protein
MEGSRGIGNESSEDELKGVANLAYIWKSQDRDKDVMELLKRAEKLKNRYSALITISPLALHKLYSNDKYYRKRADSFNEIKTPLE